MKKTLLLALLALLAIGLFGTTFDQLAVLGETSISSSQELWPNRTVFPWTQNFGTSGTTLPTGWTKQAGLLADPTVFDLPPSGNWTLDDWLNVAASNRAAKTNIWGLRNSWLFTPQLDMAGEGTPYLEFDLALLDYGTTSPGETTGWDDTFTVLVGDGLNWSHANIVRQWDNSGSQYVYNNIPHTGTHVQISLAAFSGSIKIAFYGASSIANADNDLMVDNVNVYYYTGVSNEDEIQPVLLNQLKGNYPNPFNPSTTISYSMKDAARVRIDVFNTKGQLVKNLLDAVQTGGNHELVWNGTDASGSSLGSGVYFLKMQAGVYSSTRKMMLVK